MHRHSLSKHTVKLGTVLGLEVQSKQKHVYSYYRALKAVHNLKNRNNTL